MFFNLIKIQKQQKCNHKGMDSDNVFYCLPYCMYLSLFWVSILADDLASKNRLPASVTSSLAMAERPFTFAVRYAGVSN